MPAAPRKVFLLQIQQSQLSQVLLAQARKFIQQLPQLFALFFMHVSQTVKGLKRLRFAGLQHALRARHPVCALDVNQMSDDVARAPGVCAFIAVRPRLRLIAQKRTKRCRHPLKKRNRLLQIVLHHFTHSPKASLYIKRCLASTMAPNAPALSPSRPGRILTLSRSAGRRKYS